jgi:hypothetical protein
MFVDTGPRSLPESIIHIDRLLNDIAISQILGNESAQRSLEFVIKVMSKLSLKIRWTSTPDSAFFIPFISSTRGHWVDPKSRIPVLNSKSPLNLQAGIGQNPRFDGIDRMTQCLYIANC